MSSANYFFLKKKEKKYQLVICFLQKWSYMEELRFNIENEMQLYPPSCFQFTKHFDSYIFTNSHIFFCIYIYVLKCG